MVQNNSSNWKKIIIMLIILCLIFLILSPYRYLIVEYNKNNEATKIGQVDNNLLRLSHNSLNLKELQELGQLIDCPNSKRIPKIHQKGNFWILENFITSEHPDIKCFGSVTYTTHGDFTFLSNLPVLTERWAAPISMAVYAPGTDFRVVIDSIKYLRKCLTFSSDLIKYFVTFHLYFDSGHPPESIIYDYEIDCTSEAPYTSISRTESYKQLHNLTYPINVGRNLAKDMSLTHYVLASDIELYPNPGLVKDFLQMLIRDKNLTLNSTVPKVYPIVLFELVNGSDIPMNKTQLQLMLKQKKAQEFHKNVCSSCHRVPNEDEWLKMNQTKHLQVFHIGKRLDKFKHWEPIYIGTKLDPSYDDRITWEGREDKMTQGYVLCVLDYEFHILNNAFFVHRPGIKSVKEAQASHYDSTPLIKNTIVPVLTKIYGTRPGCSVSPRVVSI